MRARAKPYDLIKRVLDVASSFVLLLITLPVQLIIAVLVSAKLGRPILFRQLRPGRDARVFTLLKFRSMKDIDPENGLISDADRLTPFGKKLRATSLDELPSLWNVLKGDLSLVGPRPLLVEYLDRYSPEQARRHEVRPGVTGLAQVRGRNSISWEEKFALDVRYVDERSFLLDAHIIARTVAVVFQQHGISSRGEATISEFKGDRS